MTVGTLPCNVALEVQLAENSRAEAVTLVKSTPPSYPVVFRIFQSIFHLHLLRRCSVHSLRWLFFLFSAFVTPNYWIVPRY